VDGFWRRYWTQDTSDVARSFLLFIDWTGSDNLTSQSGPRLRNVVVRMEAQPKTSQLWTLLLHVADDGNTALALRSELEGYRGDLLKFTLPHETAFNGVLNSTRLLRDDEIGELDWDQQDPPKYVIACEVKEMPVT
jgi:hypothetical protein